MIRITLSPLVTHRQTHLGLWEEASLIILWFSTWSKLLEESFPHFVLMWKKKQIEISERQSPQIPMPAYNPAKKLKMKSIFLILYLTCSGECTISRGSFSNTVDFLPVLLPLYFWKEIFILVHLTRELLPFMGSLEWYLYICLFLLSSLCRSEGTLWHSVWGRGDLLATAVME